jgi:hypothetical protein
VQPADQQAAFGSESQCGPQLETDSNTNAGAGIQSHVSSEADHSWQLCPLSKVGEPQLAFEQLLALWAHCRHPHCCRCDNGYV